ncbi:site-specific integrase [Lactiplantibacillus mudanjiangensis]|uniref:Site-specific integrase [Lactobacillus plantarum subsp. plantarum] n=1 Tax=Lactiplantibacillus mudanjiangensis TaxID=1296538 RepID=A0A660E9K0_9LACO|nr:site-specific integrase [Lactiplantibacillus mudanjiangensis]VDG23722.1 site-specific integrase [Lactobacillus plantarum subsp. plantarum] [Lactiplantibacillus mudanjiangensis]VDG29832.1 site-specific integrase [Lactobacillus plantarum subsp. plantarum] [Lactiplantibacillus mudanjiangensis]
MASFNQYELKSGQKRWEFRAYAGTDTGNGKQRKVHRRGFKTKRAAQDAARLIEAEIVKSSRVTNNNDNAPLGEYLLYWIDNLKVNVKSGTIVKHRHNIMYYINPRIGEYKLKDYSFNVHQKFINSLFTEEGAGRSKNGFAWNTVLSINETLSNSLEKAVRLGYIKTNPTHRVEFDRRFKPEVRKTRYFTKAQTDIFLEVAKKEHLILWYPFFLLMFDCGLRLGEDLALRWSRIDFKNKILTIDINRSYNSETHVNEDGVKDMFIDTPKTTKSIRKIPLTDRAYTALKSLYNDTHQSDVIPIHPVDTNKIRLDDFVFIKPNGKFSGYPLAHTTVQVAMRRICIRGNLPWLNVHGCRHTYGVRLRESGVSIDDIQDLMGHTDAETTKIYAEITPKIKEDAVKKLNDLLDESSRNIN